MATVSSTLKMFDAMSTPLQNITQGMNMMISTMNQMQNAAERNTNIDRTLTVAKERIAAAETEIAKAIRESEEAQNRFNRSMDKGQGIANSLTGKIKGFVGAYLGASAFQKGASIIKEWTGLADIQISSDRQLATVMKNMGATEAEFEAIKQRASQVQLETTYDSGALLGGAGELATYLGTGEAIEAMMGTLANYAAGMGGMEIDKRAMVEYATQLGKALDGQFDGLAKKGFVVTDAQKAIIEKGTEMERVAVIADIINQSWSGLAEALANTPEGQILQMKNTWDGIKETVGTYLYPAVLRFFNTLNSNLPQAQGLMMIFANAAIFIMTALGGIINAAAWLGNVIQNNWGVIEPILVAIGAALTTWAVAQIPALVTSLWKMVPPIAAAAKEWLLVNWPILLIGAAIGFVLYAMIKWGDATVEVIGFVGGLFGILFGFLYNKFASFANIVLSVAEFFVNVWQDPVYAVKKLFYDLSINALEYMTNIAKGIEGVINKIPGLHIDITSGMEGLLDKLKSARDDLKSEADVVNLMRFEQKDYGEAFDMGRNVGKKIGSAAVDGVQGAFNSLSNLFKAPGDLGGTTGWGEDGIPSVDEVGTVGKIKDKVDISSEDIKIMRELAEMKNIQNYVTLTPNLTVNTGDIRNGEDTDTIIVKLKTFLEQEIASSASAVYS